MAGMTFQWRTLVKEMLCKRDFYGQQHGNGIQICDASPNIDLKRSKAGRLLTKRGLQTLEEAGPSKTDRCQGHSTRRRGWEGLPPIHQPANQHALSASKEEHIMLNPDTTQDIGYIYIACYWCSLNVDYFLPFCKLGYPYYYYIIILLGCQYFSDCKLGGNYTPFTNFSTVFQIYPWSSDTAGNY